MIISSTQPLDAREVIGTVVSSPVYRDQVSGVEKVDLHTELCHLFLEPLVRQYRKENQSETEPTLTEFSLFVAHLKRQHEKEIAAEKNKITQRMTEVLGALQGEDLPEGKREDLVGELYYLRTTLTPPGLDYAMFVLPHWTLHRHLYLNYGRGRLVWSAQGLESYDALYNWLREQEERGLLSIIDKDVRASFFTYWINGVENDELINDAARIENLFLTPDWMQGFVIDSKGCFRTGGKAEAQCTMYKRIYRQLPGW